MNVAIGPPPTRYNYTSDFSTNYKGGMYSFGKASRIHKKKIEDSFSPGPGTYNIKSTIDQPRKFFFKIRPHTNYPLKSIGKIRGNWLMTDALPSVKSSLDRLTSQDGHGSRCSAAVNVKTPTNVRKFSRVTAVAYNNRPSLIDLIKISIATYTPKTFKGEFLKVFQCLDKVKHKIK